MYKWCLLVLGFGGLICDWVGYEVCDVYYIYYGWMCLIEMFEGFNIGLINSLFFYVKVNCFGFIEMLYWCVDWIMYKVIDKIDYLVVDEED